MGFVPEQPFLYPELTVAELMRFAAAARGLDEAESTAETARLLALLGLAGAEGTLCRELSQGMGRKTALVVALLHRPRAILLDDEARVERVDEELRRNLQMMREDFELTQGLEDYVKTFGDRTQVDLRFERTGLPRKLSLQDVYIEDRAKDTLLSGGSIKANLDIFKLFSNEVQINSFEFTDITAKIKRQLPDTTFNFQFIVDAFAPAQPTPVDTAAAQMQMNIDDVIRP